MSEGKKPGFFDRLFGRQQPQPQPKPAAPESERELPPDLVPASEVLPVAPEPAKPEEVASEIESERAEGLAPEDQHLREDAPPPGPPETTTDYAEAVDDDLATPPEPVTPVPPPAPAAPKRSWLQRLTGGLKRSSDQLTGGITAVFTKRRLDGAMLDELEDLLLTADFGIETTSAITDTLRRDRYDKDVTTAEVRAILAAEVEKVLAPVAKPLAIDAAKKPFVILMVGVNGSGKTTTIGKLAQKLAADGKSVMLAAGDTFRAAAIEQLQIWGQRTGAPVIARPAGSDASGLAFDAVSRARQEGRDVLIIDTAGRLQNRDELMSELEKIIRVIKKLDESAPHAVLLTLDATTGQNALNQVEIFGKRAGVTGLVMTKLDGTARGGILVAIARRFGLPVHFIGVGEGVDDLEAFTARDFASAIAGRE